MSILLACAEWVLVSVVVLRSADAREWERIEDNLWRQRMRDMWPGFRL